LQEGFLLAKGTVGEGRCESVAEALMMVTRGVEKTDGTVGCVTLLLALSGMEMKETDACGLTRWGDATAGGFCHLDRALAVDGLPGGVGGVAELIGTFGKKSITSPKERRRQSRNIPTRKTGPYLS